MELDDLGVWERARSLGRKAHHQDGAEREVGRQEARDPLLARERVELLQGGRAEARRPDHARDAGRERRHRVAVNGGRRGEVHRGIEARRVDHLPHLDAGHVVSRGAQGAHQDGADLALPAEEQDPHAARATASGLIRSTAARKRFSLGPMPAAESRSGA